MKKQVLVMFGGVSAEHEVSIITGLQVIEKIDKQIFEPIPVYVNKQGHFLLMPDLKSRKDFLQTKRINASFGVDEKGGYIQASGLLTRKIYPHAAYLAFHGGTGESGPMQGLLESVNIAFTSASQESQAITMNKALTKQVLKSSSLKTVDGISVFAKEIKGNVAEVVSRAVKTLALPVIVKPVHLGSSIGIKVAKTEVELEKALLESSYVDNEVVVEKFLTDFVEFNCAVRLINGELQASEIERPMSKDEILSFADKYQRGGKKSGGDGMASLQRELPAKISETEKIEIQNAAKEAFVACRCKGMVRIDFMRSKTGELFLTEINPIPGSMAFYLWEATGISFTQQITDLIEQAIKDQALAVGSRLDYQTDIVQKFVAQ